MNRTHYMGLGFACFLVALNGVSLHSAAWAGCTVEQRIELGKNGYDKGEVEKGCADDGKNVGESFWKTLSKSVVTDLANGFTDGLTKGLNNALVGRDRSSTAPTSTSASVCVTDAGTCPLSGVPSGAPCYCHAWNGTTFYGVAK